MADAIPLAPFAADPDLTPAGLQSRRTLTRRRALVAVLNLATLAALGWGLAQVFGAGGWSAAEVVIYVCFLIGAPWTVMGMWNAALGLWVLHGPRGMADAAPVVAEPDPAPIRVRVAVAMCLRNEDPARALARLAAIRDSLDATGWGSQFDVFALSDSDDPVIAAEEARLFDALKPRLGAGARYRRRAVNEAWKAGNIRDFLRRWGAEYDLFLPLDSDSLMGGETILRMTRVMQAQPRIGILQSLVVGAPSDSLFARLFQFGMRHGMRSYTAGAVWWQGEACAYWGHNALIRTAPFRAKCRLPALPGEPPLGGHILSHDQIEAALMRRAGYECRILAVESDSFEDNPPTLLDFLKRDHRWCNGNMQYFPLVGLRGLAPLSRFQIVAAIAMYFGGPAWMAMTLAAASMMAFAEPGGLNLAFGIAMFFIMFSVSLAPKVAGWIDVAATRGGVARYGGAARFAAGAVAETVFSMLLAPVAAFAVTVFMIGLAFGRRISWSGQQRDLSRVSWRQAARAMWPQTLAGLALGGAVAINAPGALVWAAPVVAGLALAIPFTVLTASPALGRAARRVGLCATPEELAPPPVLRALTDGLVPVEPLRAA
ncbi:MAG: glucans biosynthesis glucosyltransferase MdoH [Rubrimonas sp.]|uniref:glucans biosynthesis glucosyltransferase MdoH n=1 Tax=Rubrimonas sp. TaxID=2036015 RepID=UPI002FDC8BA0